MPALLGAALVTSFLSKFSLKQRRSNKWGNRFVQAMAISIPGMTPDAYSGGAGQFGQTMSVAIEPSQSFDQRFNIFGRYNAPAGSLHDVVRAAGVGGQRRQSRRQRLLDHQSPSFEIGRKHEGVSFAIDIVQLSAGNRAYPGTARRKLPPLGFGHAPMSHQPQARPLEASCPPGFEQKRHAFSYRALPDKEKGDVIAEVARGPRRPRRQIHTVGGDGDMFIRVKFMNAVGNETARNRHGIG